MAVFAKVPSFRPDIRPSRPVELGRYEPATSATSPKKRHRRKERNMRHTFWWKIIIFGKKNIFQIFSYFSVLFVLRKRHARDNGCDETTPQRRHQKSEYLINKISNDCKVIRGTVATNTYHRPTSTKRSCLPSFQVSIHLFR